jgi:TetR/AcrR family transcriptional regulator, regulator of autoinduction and epiphytic fitness
MTDPRIERTRRTVRREALAELAAAGYGGFTIESVSARSGVAKSTIYRHWPDRLTLIADALETLNVRPGSAADETPPPTDPWERVQQLLTHLAAAFRDPAVTGSTPALIEASEHDADVRAFHHGYAATRRRALVDALADGVRSGTFPAHVDPEATSRALAGAIVYSRVMTAEPFDPADVPVLLESVLGSRRT